MASERQGSAKRPPAAVGDVYGRLKVIKFLDRRQNNSGEWIQWVLVECSCENRTRKELRLTSLRSGNTRSCGCLARETTIARATTHGDHKSRLYGVWASMKNRCKSTTHRSAHRYSLKGITVCEEWQEYLAFRDWALANDYMDGKELDRKDNNLGYSPDNCEWVTKIENLDNRAKYLPEELEDWLRTHARQTESSPYEVIKAALESYLGVSRSGD
ncbi:hypothetical protein K2224_00580 [Streptomyces sp. BHT-5-2]|uniref:hypothetical protein n=1 Tax=Streptomyces sp. BHT-5-2 TaxID=2866715 RepID=UPI001C8DD597|nr:hypothetical protein [Streptomyces sp. BHT-5-2]QZL01907.1 hypothetical protein K2224_00580 [Streptomyces sp. BHT-5-2]